MQEKVTAALAHAAGQEALGQQEVTGRKGVIRTQEGCVYSRTERTCLLPLEVSG